MNAANGYWRSVGSLGIVISILRTLQPSWPVSAQYTAPLSVASIIQLILGIQFHSQALATGNFLRKSRENPPKMRPALSKVAPIGQILKNYACSSLRFVLNDKKDDEQRQDKMSQ